MSENKPLEPPARFRGWKWFRFPLEEGVLYPREYRIHHEGGYTWVGIPIADEPPKVDRGPKVGTGMLYFDRDTGELVGAESDPPSAPTWDDVRAAALSAAHRRGEWDLDQRALQLVQQRGGNSKGGKKGGTRASTFDRNDLIAERYQNLVARYERNGSELTDTDAAKQIRDQALDQARDPTEPLYEEIAKLKPDTLRRIIGKVRRKE
jgi:hypothetical protein